MLTKIAQVEIRFSQYISFSFVFSFDLYNYTPVATLFECHYAGAFLGTLQSLRRRPWMWPYNPSDRVGEIKPWLYAINLWRSRRAHARLGVSTSLSHEFHGRRCNLPRLLMERDISPLAHLPNIIISNNVIQVFFCHKKNSKKMVYFPLKIIN